LAVSASPVTDHHRAAFGQDGFAVLERAVPPEDLELLRGECQRFIDARDEEMDRLGVDTISLDHRGQRYFVHAYGHSPEIERFVTSGVMVQIARALLGATVYLFNEQYVVKAAERGMRFSWHQDSGFIDYAHQPYLSCWIALDDVSEANGTLYLLPYSRAGTREVMAHRRDEATNDRIGYVGDDPGDAIVVPAGSVVCFSSTVLHRSGANKTNAMRRAYLVQYSAEPILTEDGSEPRHLAVPVLIEGKGVIE
jgi:ectoine hydroxylase-related dioxygenase (phytanoyl-CoA dioxygenase family)